MANPEILLSRHGDTIDALIWRERGLSAADVGAVLELNPGMAAAGAVLPAATSVLVPAAAPTSPVLPLVQLWD